MEPKKDISKTFKANMVSYILSITTKCITLVILWGTTGHHSIILLALLAPTGTKQEDSIKESVT